MANLIGQTFLNQYRIDSFIASGSMGAVYRVTDLQHNLTLAMKVLHSDLADDPAIFKRFQREANALRQLKHSNIVPFYGMFQEKRLAFLLEEYIPGSSLQEILRERDGQPVPIEETLAYMKGLCAALHYAHANNVIHCDVKPGNVLVNRQGKIFLADFGISKFIGATTTTTMGVAGTPAYMSPEQIVGRGVTPLTDIYALGVVLFEMLTGQRPFRGTEPESAAGGDTTSERIRYAHLRLPLPDPRQINPNLSAALSQMILRGLTKNPAERFRSAGEFFTALCQAAQMRLNQVSDETTIIGEYHEIPVAVSTAKKATQSTKPPLSKKRRSNLLIIGGVALAVLCLTGLAGGNMLGVFPANPTVEVFASTMAPVLETLAPTSSFSETFTSTLVSSTDTQQAIFTQTPLIPTFTNIPITLTPPPILIIPTESQSAGLESPACLLEPCDSSDGDICLYGISPQPAELVISFKFKQELNPIDLPQLTVGGQKFTCDLLAGYPGRLFCDGATTVGTSDLVLVSSTNTAICSGTFNIRPYVEPTPTKRITNNDCKYPPCN